MEKNRILRDKMGFFRDFIGFHGKKREITGFQGAKLDFAGENDRSWDFTGNYVILRSNAGFYRRICVILREITGFYGIFILVS